MLEVVEGMQFDRGYISPYFVTNAEKMIAELDDPCILIHEKKLSGLQPMLPLLEAMRTGRVRERELSDVMPWGHYRNMTDEDLKGIFAFLKTLKPVDHYVDNALPPTRCAKCNLEHGGGERNKKTPNS